MVAIKEFSVAGVAITDEIVRCAEAVTVGGVGYYRGYLANTANDNIFGNDSVNYGAWTAAGKGGIRKNVLIAGYPVDVTALRVDTRNGWVYSTVAGTFYVRYLAHDPIRSGLGSVAIDVPYLLPAGTAVVLAAAGPWPYLAKCGYVMVDCEGGRPSVDAALTLSNGTSAEDVTIAAAIAAGTGSKLSELTVPLKALPGEIITVSTADGAGAFGVRVMLLDV
jgi:hypothetical protein